MRAWHIITLDKVIAISSGLGKRQNLLQVVKWKNRDVGRAKGTK